ncbi:hotdog fold thioesterase [Gemmatimonas sp.]|uniref:hotdog fold thioesterase n=1 Tax=Gemmatimonas sp. TaxID=1962908 RepID=UPI00286A20CE|nr:hotdog fold thioesterase [Gemmatimonas sp.]
MSTPSAADVVNTLMARDLYSQWLGIEVVEAAVGTSVLRMTIRDEMVNGFGTSHGGIMFSLADSALAFATNACGMLSVAVDCSISFPVAVRPGDVLIATAIEQSTTKRLAFCDVSVRNQADVLVGHFRGTVYRTATPHQL